MIFKLRIIAYFLAFRFNRWWYRFRPGRLRQKRLGKLLLHLRKSPYYHHLARQSQGLETYPIINKAVFMEEFDQINTAGIRIKEAQTVAMEAENSRNFSPEIRGITVGLSSGTSGNLGIFLASSQERARWVAAVLDRVIGLSWKKRKVAFFLRANSPLYESARSSLLEFRFFDLFLPFDQHLKHLQQYQPDIIVAQPSVLRLLVKAIVDNRLSINPQKVISVAEVLYPEDRTYFESVFGLSLGEVYQCTEGFLAASCPEGRLHFNEDFIHLERKYLDASRTYFHPVITDLLRYTQPVIRYELNDVILAHDSCQCNWTGSPIAYIEGRSDDCWTFEKPSGKRVTVFPDLIRRAVLKSSDQISFYVLTQVSNHRVEIYLETESQLINKTDIQQKLRRELNLVLMDLGIPNLQIHFSNSYRHESGSKLRRIRKESAQEGLYPRNG